MRRCLKCQNCFDSEDWRCPECGNSPDSGNGYPSFIESQVSSEINFEPEFVDDLYQAEERHFWFKQRRRLIVHLFRRYAAANGCFLEIGSGTGYVLSGLLRAFPLLRATASDGLAVSLNYLQQRFDGNVELIHAHSGQLPFFDEFTAAGAFDVLEHIEDDEAVIAGLFESLKTDGTLFVSVPQHRWLWSNFDDWSGHCRRYEPGELESKLEAAGFQVRFSGSFMAFLVPLMYVSRMLNLGGDKNQDALKIGSFENVVLNAVSSVEVWLTTLGVRFPIGGTRMIVAQK